MINNSIRTTGIYILFFEKLKLTQHCIESFLPSGCDIYVLNNGSSRESTRKLEAFCKRYSQIKIFHSSVNLGVANGRNLLIKDTSKEWLFFVDNDITINEKQSWTRTFEELMLKFPDTKVFVPKLFNSYAKIFEPHSNIELVDNTVFFRKANSSFLNKFPGGASIIHRSIFDKYGYYDKDMFVGWEDFEFAIRGLKNDDPLKCKLVNEINLTHHHEYTFDSKAKEAIRIRYNAENIKKSFDRIVEKHGLVLEKDGLLWSQEQIEKLTKINPLRKMINHYRRKIKFKLNQLING